MCDFEKDLSPGWGYTEQKPIMRLLQVHLERVDPLSMADLGPLHQDKRSLTSISLLCLTFHMNWLKSKSLSVSFIYMSHFHQ